MNNKILIVAAFAALSAVAMAQSAPSKDKKPAQGATAASGQASGKRMHQPMATTPDNSKAAPIGGSHDRESSAPSVSEVVMTKPASDPKRVATGDVNGDGRADVAATAGSAKGNGQGTSNNGSSASDVASGHATGKRQHEPVTVQKQQDSASPQK